jgi:hypothetical protein
MLRLLNHRDFGRPRPHPPAALLGVEGASTKTPIRPADDLVTWVRATFIELDGPLANEDHAHLRFAEIGMLWAAVPNNRHMKAVVGEAEIPTFRCGKWQKARQEQQLIEWFGDLPNFVITIDVEYAARADDAAFCALLEHELYHCAQELDEFGAPKFRKDGTPAFTMKGHDVEEFVGVVARYGAGAATGKTAELVRAANKGPQIGEARIHGACGTCGRMVA